MHFAEMHNVVSRAVVDDGHLDVSYVMNIPVDEIPDLLGRIGQTLDTGELLDCFGSMRVKSLVVHCPDGLQVFLFSTNKNLKTPRPHDYHMISCRAAVFRWIDLS